MSKSNSNPMRSGSGSNATKRSPVFARFARWVPLVVTVAISLSMILLWLFRAETIRSYVPARIPLAFNVAVLFLLAAVAQGFAWRRVNLKMLIGIVLVVVPAATAMQNLFSIDLGIDQLLVQVPSSFGSRHPGRMAINTAFAFICLGLSLIAWTRAQQNPKWGNTSAALAVLVASIGIVSLVGYVTGLQRAYFWGGDAKMSLLTAVCFLMLGLGMLLRAMEAISGDMIALRRYMPLYAGIVAILVTVILWRALLAKEADRISAATLAQAAATRDLIQLDLNSRITALEQMAERWDFSRGTPREAWIADAESYLRDFSGLDTIALVDQNFKLRWTVPTELVKGREGIDVRIESRRRKAFETAAKLGRTVLSQAVELTMSEQGFVACIPIFSGERLDGFIAVPIRAQSLSAAAGLGDRYLMSLKEDGVTVYSNSLTGNEANAVSVDSTDWIQSVSVSYLNLEWTLELRPTAKTLKAQRSALPIFFLLTGIAFALLIVMVLRSYLSALIASDESWRSEQRQKAIFESSDLLVMSCDANGVVQSLNVAAQKLLGYSASEVCGKLPMSLWHDLTELQRLCGTQTASMQLAYYELLARVRHSGHFKGQFTFIAKDGRKFLAQVGINALWDTDGQLAGFVSIAEDQTEKLSQERKIFEQQAAMAAAAKMSSLGEMAGGLAHELNSPLNVILGRAEQIKLLSEGPNPPSAKEVAGRMDLIIVTVERMAKIIRGLRSFARDASSDPLIDENVAKIVEETLAFCSARMKSQSIRVEAAIDPNLSIACRPSEISQVILNLLNNAHDALVESADRWIRIEARQTLVEVEISVTDSGVGIEPEFREKIMQPFFTTKEIGKGVGLGLSISRGLAKSHGGSLTLDPHSAQTRFVLRVPSAGTKKAIQAA